MLREQRECHTRATGTPGAADAIYVNESSIVGSIGVLMNGFGFVEAIDKLRLDRIEGKLGRLHEDLENLLSYYLLQGFADAGGGELPGMIISFDDEEVTVDFNHPLAGRTILFDVLVHRVEAAELH